MTQTLTMLSNAKGIRVFGDPTKGTSISLFPGASSLPAKLFQAVHDGDDAQGVALRAHMKAGTFTQIENAEPLTAAQVAELNGDALVAAACKHGDVETRARLAHRYWYLSGADIDNCPPNARHWFEPLQPAHADRINVSPTDQKSGWRVWLAAYTQKHSDQLLTAAANDRAAAREHQANIASAAAAVQAAAQKGA